MIEAKALLELNLKKNVELYLKELEKVLVEASVNGYSSVEVPERMLTKSSSLSYNFPPSIKDEVKQVLSELGYKVAVAESFIKFGTTTVVISWD